MASARPGARLDPRSFAVSWQDRAFGRVTVSIGGCYHYSLRVSAVRALPARPDDAELLAFAARLVEAHWPKPYATTVAAALRRQAPAVEVHADRALHRIAVDGFDEVTVESSHQQGKATVSVLARIPT